MSIDRRTGLGLLSAGIAGSLIRVPAFGQGALPTSEIFPDQLAQAPETSQPGPIASYYVSSEDQIKLAVDVVLPQGTGKTKFPALLVMTRYWRGMEGSPLDRIQSFYARRGFAVIVGDVRGTGASFGQWRYQRSRAETKDFTAIMNWIVAQGWSDGRIVATGNSYGANTADWMAERNHPALKAIAPRFADYDPYADLYFPGGVPNAFMGQAWGTMTKNRDLNIYRDSNGKLTPGVRPVDGPDGRALLNAALAERASLPSVWEGLQQITFRDDRPVSWQGASMTDYAIASHIDRVEQSGTPIQNWAGWFDSATANGAVHRFLADKNPLHVIIGPWSHGGYHDFDPLNPRDDKIPPSFAVQQTEDLRFFHRSLTGDKALRRERLLSYYTCGEGRWKTTTVWPPAHARPQDWYFGPDSSLATTPSGEGSDSYKVDFTVGTGKGNRWATQFGAGPVFYDDRSEVDRRLLCYTSAPLKRDTEITGNPVVRLFLTSTHDDGAVFVYLETVAPDGKVIYLTEAQFRVIHRRVATDAPLYPTVGPYHSFLRKDAMPLVPGQIAELTFELNPVSVRVPGGYRLRIAIAGADADVFTRLPANGDPILQVHRAPTIASKITLPIINET